MFLVRTFPKALSCTPMVRTVEPHRTKGKRPALGDSKVDFGPVGVLQQNFIGGLLILEKMTDIILT